MLYHKDSLSILFRIQYKKKFCILIYIINFVLKAQHNLYSQIVNKIAFVLSNMFVLWVVIL